MAGACRLDEDRADSGAYCPTRSMVREPYDGIIGEAPDRGDPVGESGYSPRLPPATRPTRQW